MKQWYVWAMALLLVIVIVFGASYFNFKGSTVIRALNTIIAPFQNGITYLSNSWRRARLFITDYRDFQENHALYHSQIAELERKLFEMEELVLENQRLRALLDFEHGEDFQLQGAQVIGHYTDIWTQGIIINKGINHGVNIRMPVITYSGYLVGIIEEVFVNSAHVQLLTDPSFAAGAMIQREDSRGLGVLRGQMVDKDLYLMDNISWDADVIVGDLIITSGMGSFFPKGLQVGTIKDIYSDDYGLSQSASFRPHIVDITVEEVAVLIDLNKE